MSKERLDVLLVKRGLAPSREKAKAIIMSGIVFVDNEREDKAGTTFDEKVNIEVRGKTLKYVSRGGLKLEKAMDVFGVKIEGKTCMDVGASTGGFTDCMLQNGAVKVYSVDVGHGQLAWKLVQDDRVICMDRTNIRYVTPDQIDDVLDFASIDVSFISLTKVLLPVKNLLKENGQIVCLIKPQFEAGRENVGKKGVVRDKKVHKDVIESVITFAMSIGFDIINLDFYNLYSEFDTNKMEENAIDFTRRLLENRFQYYVGSMDQFFDDKMTMTDVYTMFFRTSMNVPRIMGYLLAYLYQSVIIYGKKITKQDIENASEKYYEDNIDAFFRSSTYCLLSIEEKRNIAQLKKVRDAIVDQAKEIKRQIVKGELTGRLYQKAAPYSSHFHVLQNTEKYLESLELNHFITKYEEKSNRDGKKVNVYCLNYGLAKKNNIIWGRAQGTIYRKYFIERIFNFTSLILEQIRETKVIKCTNPACGRIFDDSEIPFLKFTRFQCPDCHSKVETYSKVDEEIEHQFQQANKIPLVSKEELDIILELNRRKEFCKARDIAEEIDMESRRIAQICKKLDEDKGIVIRNKKCNPYEYCTSEIGEKYSDVEVS